MLCQNGTYMMLCNVMYRGFLCYLIWTYILYGICMAHIYIIYIYIGMCHKYVHGIDLYGICMGFVSKLCAICMNCV